MSKFLVSFITSIILITLCELILLCYILINIDTDQIWLAKHHNFWIFIATSLILIFAHIFWIYSFISTHIHYKNYLKLNDSMVFISLCTKIFSMFWVVMLIIFSNKLHLSENEAIILCIIFINILLLGLFDFFILFNYKNFNHRFVKNIINAKSNDNIS